MKDKGVDRIRRQQVKKILFISLSNIGDIVLTTPVLGVLHTEFPYAQIDVLSGPNGYQIFSGHPYVANYIPYDKHTSLKNKLSLIFALRKKRYDCVVDLRNSLFPYLLGATYKTSIFNLSSNSPVNRKMAHLYKLRTLAIYYEDAPFCFYIGSEDYRTIDVLLKRLALTEKGFVVLSPGAKSHLKRWQEERYAYLSKRINLELKMPVVLVGDENDKDILNRIERLHSGVGLHNLCGCLTIRQLGALLMRCRILVTNDSAPLHIAWALGVRVVAIFGPTDPEKYAPFGQGYKVVRKRLDCSPCESAQCKFGTIECISKITVEEVFSDIKSLL